MPVKLTAPEFAAQWKQRLDAATDRITTGVGKVTEAPGKRAAASADKMRARLLESLDTGRWQGAVAKVSVEDWKKAMVEKGIPRIRAGTAGAVPQMEAFAREFFPHLEAGIARIRAMPSVTLDDNIERAVAMMRHNSTFTFKQ